MPCDITPLTRALDDATPGVQRDVYGLLAAWNQSITTALDRGGWSRFREIMRQCLEEVIELVDTAGATTEGIDWEFLKECVDAYPPGVGDHHCSAVLANIVARCVIRTRISEGVDAIPTWSLDYLADITMDDDGESAWESAAAFGWAVGHPTVAVLDRTVERAERGEESWTMGVLRHVAFANPEAGVDLLDRLLQSPDVVENLLFVRQLELPFTSERNFPPFPEYWEPQTELDYQVMIADDVHERLLVVIGESIHPDRLRQFDESYSFDFDRAADEYGSVDDE